MSNDNLNGCWQLNCLSQSTENETGCVRGKHHDISCIISISDLWLLTGRHDCVFFNFRDSVLAGAHCEKMIGGRFVDIKYL
jgi:hypothetical protein